MLAIEDCAGLFNQPRPSELSPPGFGRENIHGVEGSICRACCLSDFSFPILEDAVGLINTMSARRSVHRVQNHAVYTFDSLPEIDQPDHAVLPAEENIYCIPSNLSLVLSFPFCKKSAYVDPVALFASSTASPTFPPAAPSPTR